MGEDEDITIEYINSPEEDVLPFLHQRRCPISGLTHDSCISDHHDWMEGLHCGTLRLS